MLKAKKFKDFSTFSGIFITTYQIALQQRN